MGINPEHLRIYDDLDRHGCMRSPMLVLGRQVCEIAEYKMPKDFFASYGVTDYTDLDPDGGMLKLDLNRPLHKIWGNYEAVFNIGTLEHIWDVHVAWSNALAAVRVGGVFVTFSPVTGWVKHCIHITGARWIEEFILSNGFSCIFKTIHKMEKGNILVFAARRDKTVETYLAPQQIYKSGRKK